MNKAVLEGFLGRDPEVRFTQSGMAVANLSLATNELRGPADNRQKFTEWHRIVAFGKMAEMVQSHYKKGKQVLVEGRLQTREWEDKNGVKRYTTEVIAGYMKLLGKGDGSSPAANTPPVESYEIPDAAALQHAPGPDQHFDDDIPF